MKQHIILVIVRNGPWIYLSIVLLFSKIIHLSFHHSDSSSSWASLFLSCPPLIEDNEPNTLVPPVYPSNLCSSFPLSVFTLTWKGLSFFFCQSIGTVTSSILFSLSCDRYFIPFCPCFLFLWDSSMFHVAKSNWVLLLSFFFGFQA